MAQQYEGTTWRPVRTVEGEQLGYVPVPLFEAAQRGEVRPEELVAVARDHADPERLGHYVITNERAK